MKIPSLANIETGKGCALLVFLAAVTVIVTGLLIVVLA